MTKTAIYTICFILSYFLNLKGLSGILSLDGFICALESLYKQPEKSYKEPTLARYIVYTYIYAYYILFSFALQINLPIYTIALPYFINNICQLQSIKTLLKLNFLRSFINKKMNLPKTTYINIKTLQSILYQLVTVSILQTLKKLIPIYYPFFKKLLCRLTNQKYPSFTETSAQKLISQPRCINDYYKPDLYLAYYRVINQDSTQFFNLSRVICFWTISSFLHCHFTLILAFLYSEKPRNYTELFSLFVISLVLREEYLIIALLSQTPFCEKILYKLYSKALKYMQKKIITSHIYNKIWLYIMLPLPIYVKIAQSLFLIYLLSSNYILIKTGERYNSGKIGLITGCNIICFLYSVSLGHYIFLNAIAYNLIF